jgi:pilus assembly protein TadC
VGTLPELLDLLGVAASAGLPVAAALEVVAPRAPAPWSGAVGACLAAAGEGALLAEALPTLTEHAGEAAGPLVGVLRSALVDGDRLVPGLAGLAADARDLRRRRAQEAAGRLPVRLLAPLVACSLPAVAVLTIVPIVAGALAGLRLEP